MAIMQNRNIWTKVQEILTNKFSTMDDMISRLDHYFMGYGVLLSALNKEELCSHNWAQTLFSLLEIYGIVNVEKGDFSELVNLLGKDHLYQPSVQQLVKEAIGYHTPIESNIKFPLKSTKILPPPPIATLNTTISSSERASTPHISPKLELVSEKIDNQINIRKNTLFLDINIYLDNNGDKPSKFVMAMVEKLTRDNNKFYGTTGENAEQSWSNLVKYMQDQTLIDVNMYDYAKLLKLLHDSGEFDLLEGITDLINKFNKGNMT